MPRVLCHAQYCVRRPSHEFRLDGSRKTAARLCKYHSEMLSGLHPITLGGKRCPVCGDSYDAGRIEQRQGVMQFTHDGGRCRVDVRCEPQTVRIEDFTADREFDHPVAEVCHYCPNTNCPGAADVDDENACRTMRWWKKDTLDLAQAAAAKQYQHERHRQTDAFRDWVFHQVAEANNVTSEEAETDRDYNKRRDAGKYASVVAKGQNACDAKRELEQDLWIHISTGLCRQIEEKREEMIEEPTR